MPATVQHAKNVTIADYTGVVTVGNSSGGTTTANATDLARPSDWNSAHNLTFNIAASEIASLFSFRSGLSSTTDANGITAGVEANGFFEPFPQPNTNSTVSAPGIGTWYLDPVCVPVGIGPGLIFMPVVGGLSTNVFQDGAVWSATLSGSNTRYQTHYNKIGLYKRGSGASTSRLESFWTAELSAMVTWERRHSGAATSNGTISNYLTVSLPAQWNLAGGVTYTSNAASGTVSYGVSTGASTLASSLITGPARFFSGSRMEVIPFATTIPPGEYVFAHMYTSSTSVTGTNYTAGTVWTTQSRLGLLENNMGAFKLVGKSTTNATSTPLFWHGYMATTTSNVSSIINTSDVRSTTGRAYWHYAQTTF